MARHDTLAAVDLGSNSFHLQIGRVVDGQIYPLDAVREVVRLGAGLTAEKRIDRGTQAQALETLAKFAERRNCFGHQAFTASFINRRFRAVCDRDGHSALTCRDCSCQPRGAASHHKHIQLCSA